jgi:hypothetical protein
MPSPNVEARIPGARWFHGLRNPILRIGIQTGFYLSAVMLAAVLLTNRAPWLEGNANLRNWAARAVFAMVMLLPIVTLWRSAGRLLAAGTLGWSLAAITYIGLGLFFSNLYTRLRTPGEFFILGAIVYGVAAVVSWLASLAVNAWSRHQAALATPHPAAGRSHRPGL